MKNLEALAKMKVADLKRELKLRGLSVSGNKNELTERLHSAVVCGGEEILENQEINEDFDEEEILGDEEIEEEIDSELTPQEEEAALQGSALKIKDISSLIEPERKKICLKRGHPPPVFSPPPVDITPTPPPITPEVEGEEGKVGEGGTASTTTATVVAAAAAAQSQPRKMIKLSGSAYVSDPKARAERFGLPLTDTARKEARKARFGSTDNGETNGKSGKQSEEEKKSARAARFGLTKTTGIISVEGKKDEMDKMLKRAQRFGETTAPSLVKHSEEEKRKARMKRFGETGTLESKKTELPQEAKITGVKKINKLVLITASDEEEKKRKRAMRFAV